MPEDSSRTCALSVCSRPRCTEGRCFCLRQGFATVTTYHDLSRSVSLSEKELREAKARSQRIAAQLTTPPSSNSRGVQLFNRRKQRVSEFTLESYGKSRQESVEGGSQGPLRSNSATCEKGVIERPPLETKNVTSTSPSQDRSAPYLERKPSANDVMEENRDNTNDAEEVTKPLLPAIENVRAEDTAAVEINTGLCTVPVTDETEQDPISVDLNNGSTGRPTNELHESRTEFSEHVVPVSNGVNAIQIKKSNESPVSAPKQVTIINRTARPFGSPVPAETNFPKESSSTVVFAPPLIQATRQFGSPSPVDVDLPKGNNPTVNIASPLIQTARQLGSPSPVEASLPRENSSTVDLAPTLIQARPFGSPSSIEAHLPKEGDSTVDFLPPLIQTASISSPPRLTRVLSPPTLMTYSSSIEFRPTYEQESKYNERKSAPKEKTGILDEAIERRAAKKSMFTFREKPKVSPNPELLSLVQSSDEKKKHKEQREATGDDEHLALGAEASNFLHESTSKHRTPPSDSDNVPEWSSCLKTPERRVMLQPKPPQTLTEVKGKGAELFAKRQSRMEKYVVESPAVTGGPLRPPSPTMSLPPSWKYSNNQTRLRCMPSPAHPPFTSSRTFKARPSMYLNNGTSPVENGSSRKESEIAKHQPYQLNSSLFILSPSKDPVQSLPRAAPPPKPRVFDSTPFAKQNSCPFNHPPPSPLFDCPTPFRASRQLSSPLSPASPNSTGMQDFRPSPGVPVEAPHSPQVLSPPIFRVSSPRTKMEFQAPRPSFSARDAGIEAQVRRESLPINHTWTPNSVRRMSSLEACPASTRAPALREGRVSPAMSPSPTSPASPPWVQRSQSPLAKNPNNKRMVTLLAKNIINAAKRKSSLSTSPGASCQGSPVSPPSNACLSSGSQRVSVSPFNRIITTQSPTVLSPPHTPLQMTRSPVKLYSTRSLTDSDISIDSEDSGTKSPGTISYNICPRGWTGSLRSKRGSVTSEA
ncbi:synaptopodin isoform X2 [Latimeria chalumnae]|uniref:synaptopodin isoform X2 n=1 Tax=Latimeria chalumnae TaxID=7897 RepID=UPI0003C110F0|nr:PREDICTED: synaptopodin isoform X2 [Latimeria chalumnae]|eukprot:XP_005988351.1 PREDICTED: synaptopodin isoform X2 [Latimeria chalumnae]